MSQPDKVPIYVTRKNGDGVTGTYRMSPWMSSWAVWMAWVNIMVWGIVGLVVAVRTVIA